MSARAHRYGADAEAGRRRHGPGRVPVGQDEWARWTRQPRRGRRRSLTSVAGARGRALRLREATADAGIVDVQVVVDVGPGQPLAGDEEDVVTTRARAREVRDVVAR